MPTCEPRRNNPSASSPATIRYWAWWKYVQSLFYLSYTLIPIMIGSTSDWGIRDTFRNVNLSNVNALNFEQSHPTFIAGDNHVNTNINLGPSVSQALC